MLWRFVWKPQAGVSLPVGVPPALPLSLFMSFLDYSCPPSSPTLSLFPPPAIPIPLSGDRRTNLLRWHFYRMSSLNYDPWLRLCPKLSHDLKLQINLLQITCQTPAGEDVESLLLPRNSWWRSRQENGAFPSDQKSLVNDPLPLFATRRICQYHNISSLVGCDANCKWHVSCQKCCSLWDK